MATPFVGIAWRKVGWIVGGVVGLIWFLTYRNFMNAEIADLQLRLQRSMASSEALATQLQVINNHKDRINQMIETEKAFFARKTEELNRKATELQSQRDLLTNELKECQSRISNLNVHLEEKEEVGRKVAEAIALRLAVNGRVDSAKQSVDNGSQQVTKLNVEPPKLPQPAVDEAGKAGAAKEEEKNPVLLAQPEQLPVPPDHGYVNGNSVHFHRQESANKALEFQRDGAVDGGAPAQPPVDINNDVDNHAGDAENGAENSERQVVKPHFDASVAIHENMAVVAAVPKRTNKKKRRRNKDGRENDEDEEIVMDFRQNDLPDKEKIADYKEMPQ